MFLVYPPTYHNVAPRHDAAPPQARMRNTMTAPSSTFEHLITVQYWNRQQEHGDHNMTTDAFTQAARAEAEARFRFVADMTIFKDAAEWARAYLAGHGPQSIPPEDQLEVVGEWLVIRGVQEPDYPAGPEWGPMPYSDAAPIVHLAQVAGFPPEPQEPTDAEVEAAALSILADEDGFDLSDEDDAFHVREVQWGGMDEDEMSDRLDTARAALSAAREARR